MRLAKRRQLADRVDQRLLVVLRAAAPLAQQARRLHGIDQFARARCAHRRRGKGHVLEQLHGRAARAEHHHGPERRVHVYAHDGFHAALEHGGDQHAVYARLGRGGLGAAQQFAVGLAHGFGVLQVEHHAADLGLVGDVGRGDLGNDGKAEFRGRGRGVFGAGADLFGQHGQAGCGQHLLGRGLGGDIAQGLRRTPGRRGRVQRLVAARELARAGQGQHRARRVGKRRDAMRVQRGRDFRGGQHHHHDGALGELLLERNQLVAGRLEAAG